MRKTSDNPRLRNILQNTSKLSRSQEAREDEDQSQTGRAQERGACPGGILGGHYGESYWNPNEVMSLFNSNEPMLLS